MGNIFTSVAFFLNGCVITHAVSGPSPGRLLLNVSLSLPYLRCTSRSIQVRELLNCRRVIRVRSVTGWTRKVGVGVSPPGVVFYPHAPSQFNQLLCHGGCGLFRPLLSAWHCAAWHLVCANCVWSCHLPVVGTCPCSLLDVCMCVINHGSLVATV